MNMINGVYINLVYIQLYFYLDCLVKKSVSFSITFLKTSLYVIRSTGVCVCV